MNTWTKINSFARHWLNKILYKDEQKLVNNIVDMYFKEYEPEITKVITDSFIYGTGFIEQTWNNTTNSIQMSHIPYSTAIAANYVKKTRSRAKSSSKTTKRKSSVKKRSKKPKKFNTKTKSRVR